MKTISELGLAQNEISALREFKSKILEKFPGSEIILFGSKARGDATRESDLDVLAILPVDSSAEIVHELSALQLRVELDYDVVIGLVAEGKQRWNSPKFSVMPLRQNIEREGGKV